MKAYKIYFASILASLLISNCKKETKVEEEKLVYETYQNIPCSIRFGEDYITLEKNSITPSNEYVFDRIEDYSFYELGAEAHDFSSTYRMTVRFDHTSFSIGKYSGILTPYIEDVTADYSKISVVISFVDAKDGYIFYKSQGGVAYINKYAKDKLEVSFCNVTFKNENFETLVGSGHIKITIPEEFQYNE